MKPTRLFPIHFTLLTLAAVLAATLLFAGCATTDSGDSRNSDYSGHQHHH